MHRACEDLNAKIAGSTNIGGGASDITAEVARRFPDGIEGEGALAGQADDPNYKAFSHDTYGATFADVAASGRLQTVLDGSAQTPMPIRILSQAGCAATPK